MLPDRELHQLVSARQDNTCAACGAGLPVRFAVHHRTPRHYLGNCACNLVGLHHSCHNLDARSVHQRPEQSKARGLIVPWWEDTRHRPVPHHTLGAVWLACDGGYTTTPPT